MACPFTNGCGPVRTTGIFVVMCFEPLLVTRDFGSEVAGIGLTDEGWIFRVVRAASVPSVPMPGTVWTRPLLVAPPTWTRNFSPCGRWVVGTKGRAVAFRWPVFSDVGHDSEGGRDASCFDTATGRETLEPRGRTCLSGRLAEMISLALGGTASFPLSVVGQPRETTGNVEREAKCFFVAGVNDAMNLNDPCETWLH